MLAKAHSIAIFGMEAHSVEVEVDVAHGLPAAIIVGLPDLAVKESKDRIKSAIKNSRFEYPPKRVTINLAPADVKKEGPSFDLPISLGFLAATKQLSPEKLNDYIILGELALDGSVRPVKGALLVALSIRSKDKKKLILPQENAAEAAIIKEIEVYGIRSLVEAVKLIEGEIQPAPFRVNLADVLKDLSSYEVDFSDVKGQFSAKRAIEIAAAGSHNVLMIGPPGAGKTMLARRMSTIIPDMSLKEALETTQIHSVAGFLSSGQALVTNRPFRTPHHTSSSAALVGGSSVPQPGEVSLAHNGVLFLDELPEFHRDVLEALRQPLEDNLITISRISRTTTFPARVLLIATMNPCPCGYFSDPVRECHCTPHQIQKYRSRASGPLLDRIDIHIEVPSLKYKDFTGDESGEPSNQIKERVNKARQIQQKRFREENIHCNATMGQKQIKLYCKLDKEGKELLKVAVNELGISARAYDRILKVARTIADLSEEDAILAEHISEAIQYKSLDKSIFA
ncbi:ATP-binding protein [candidate division NPL-UPA2 bacterium Unc8]|uniref:ATP-binding protein n=1 Tax=candidate division NPL-UPA2 bacterium Unc8 TaxID=1980939 RepID=A0A399FVZ7_UNCN2|nr:Competence protein ComM [Bacillota bacterium]MBT9137866.1 Competence protein ComM [Bacillota bacterium]MBT9147099.1 Competence protein ComM [Bacillota bacterium]RIH99665.1 MAG: ATP-binding protein [candidate division NPL-UPA2 bacterium Unc8]